MIKLDLHNLTEEKIAEAMTNIGKCTYSSPCIIGALMTPEQRKLCDQAMPMEFAGMFWTPTGAGVAGLDQLINRCIVSFPADQVDVAISLQDKFDTADFDNGKRFNEVLSQVRDLYMENVNV